jgi:hypothetical protein
VLARTRETRSAAQLKTQWCHALRHRVHGHVDDVMVLASLFGRVRGSLPVAQLAGKSSEVTSKLKAKGIMI